MTTIDFHAMQTCDSLETRCITARYAGFVVGVCGYNMFKKFLVFPPVHKFGGAEFLRRQQSLTCSRIYQHSIEPQVSFTGC
jgi:hypothetical protein